MDAVANTKKNTGPSPITPANPTIQTLSEPRITFTRIPANTGKKGTPSELRIHIHGDDMDTVIEGAPAPGFLKRVCKFQLYPNEAERLSAFITIFGTGGLLALTSYQLIYLAKESSNSTHSSENGPISLQIYVACLVFICALGTLYSSISKAFCLSPKEQKKEVKEAKKEIKEDIKELDSLPA